MPWLIYAGIALGAYYVGRQKGIADQKTAASSTNLLGQQTTTPGTLGGQTPVQNVLGTDILK